MKLKCSIGEQNASSWFVLIFDFCLVNIEANFVMHTAYK